MRSKHTRSCSIMYKMLLWLSSDNSNRAFIFGALTAAALAGAYIIWGPNSAGGRKTRKGKIPGLLNLGKSCFVNAVLQSLASSATIVKWLGSLNAKFSQLQPGEDNITLISALYRILSVLNSQDVDYEGHSANAEELLNALRKRRWAISDDEQDAHEMFHVLTTTIEEELQKSVAAPSLADAARLDSPIKFDTFDSVSLSIPSSQWPELTLRDCLRHFMMPEQVKDVECEKCQQTTDEDDDGDRTKTRSTSVKCLTIGKLPDVLCIHMQRMTWLNNGMPMKQYRHVTFSEYLDMSEFVYSNRIRNGGSKSSTSLMSNLIGGSATPDRKPLSNGCGPHPISPLPPAVSQLGLNQNQSSTVSPLIKTALGNGSLFRLQAVIVHLGDVHSGHFMTYRRGALQSPYRKLWYLCSDLTVREVPASEVFQCSAYMLLYERVGCGDIHRLAP